MTPFLDPCSLIPHHHLITACIPLQTTPLPEAAAAVHQFPDEGRPGLELQEGLVGEGRVALVVYHAGGRPRRLRPEAQVALGREEAAVDEAEAAEARAGVGGEEEAAVHEERNVHARQARVDERPRQEKSSRRRSKGGQSSGEGES